MERDELVTRVKESKVFGESQVEGVVNLLMEMMEPLYSRVMVLEKKVEIGVVLAFPKDVRHALAMAKELVVRYEAEIAELESGDG